MTDINWLDKIYLWNIFELNDFFIYFIFVVFFWILYIILNKKNEIKNDKNKMGDLKKILIKPKNFFEELKNIEKNFLDSEENIFYWKISWILKEILEEKRSEKFKKNIENMTYSEIQNLDFWEEWWGKKIIDLISWVYFKSYKKELRMEWERVLDENEKRLNLIWEIKNVIENKNKKI